MRNVQMPFLEFNILLYKLLSAQSALCILASKDLFFAPHNYQLLCQSVLLHKEKRPKQPCSVLLCGVQTTRSESNAIGLPVMAKNFHWCLAKCTSVNKTNGVGAARDFHSNGRHAALIHRKCSGQSGDRSLSTKLHFGNNIRS